MHVFGGYYFKTSIAGLIVRHKYWFDSERLHTAVQALWLRLPTMSNFPLVCVF